MRIAKTATLEEIEPQHWDPFAKDVCIAAPYLHRRIASICQDALVQVEEADRVLNKLLPSEHDFGQFSALIADRAQTLQLKAR